MLGVYISRNNFSNRKKDYAFHSRNCGTVTQEEFIKKISEANTTVTEADTIAVFTLIEQIFNSLIDEGYTVQLPMGTFRAGASGTAASAQESFTPRPLKTIPRKNDHRISLLFKPDLKREKQLKYSVKYEKTDNKTVCSPLITSLFTMDDQDPGRIEPGALLSIHGEYLKVDTTDKEQGVFLYRHGRTDGEPYRVSVFARNARRILSVVIPRDIPKDTYVLCVRTRPFKRLLSARSRSILIIQDTDAGETSLTAE